MTSERSSRSASSSSVITTSLAGALPAGYSDLWYDGDQINRLLHHLVGHRTDIEIFAPINIEQSDTLRINLWDEQIQQALRISKGAALASTYVLPINLGNRHWAALYLHFPTTNRLKPHVSYFDPYGTSVMPAELVQALSAIYTDLKPEDLFVCPLQLQRDTYNCGPWVVAIFESLLATRRFPEEGLDIQRKRAEYALMLQGKPKRGEGAGDAKEEKKEGKRSSQPFLFSQAAKDKTAEPEKASATLAEQQLAALLKEAEKYQAKAGYENQIKAAFYYQVALVFCEKKLKELADAAKKEEKKSVVKEIKTAVSVLDLSSLTKILSKDFSVFYTTEKEKIIQALADLEQAYPEKSLCLSPKTLLGSPTALKESKTPATPLPSREIILKRLINNPHQIELQRIRTKAADLLETYKKQSTLMASETKAERKSIVTMQSIYRELTTDMKQLVRQMIAECIEEYSGLLGYPPCDYTFFGLGSMARDEMTPYSDLEFGILMAEEDQSGINKSYFQHITQLLHLKIINLSETIPRIMGVKLPTVEIHTGLTIEHDEIPNPVPNGLSFDGVGPGGCKNPFGRKDKFELIGMPEALADYQDQRHYEDKGNLQDERFLPASLAHVTFIAGGKAHQPLLAAPIETSSAEDEALLKKYRTAVHQHLDQPTKNLWGKPLKKGTLTRRQARALELLLSDLERFSPKMGKVEADGRSYSVKHDFYRLPNTLLDQVALYYGLEARSLWDQIGMLAKPTTDDSSPLLSKEAVVHLQRAIDSINFHRLNAYLHLGEQSEEAYLQDDQGVVQTYGQTYQRHYALPASEAFAIYYCLIPLWQAVKRFRDSAGDKRAFQMESLGLYSESSLVKGKIKQLLQGHYQALPDFENAVKTAKQSAEAFTASLKTPVAAVKENKDGKGALENKSAASSGSSSKELADALYVLGTTQFELRQYAVAESNLKAALKIFQALGRDAIAETSACLLSLILALKPQSKKRATDAHTYLAEATDLITYHYGKRHPYFARIEAIKGDLETVFHHTTTDWHIPASNDESFVGREALLKKLADHFVAMEVGQRLVLSAVSGLGGVGKTTLAIQYLHHSKHPYELRVWFRADNATTLLADYQDFAIAKGLVLRGEKTDSKALIHLVKTHLEKHTGWLAIYDNVENYDEIQSYLPVKGGHVILSTRRHEWPKFWSKERTAGWHKMEVDVFTLEEALSYLKKFTGRGLEEEASMKLLAEALGRLPLALAQAAAYIKRRGVTVADYLNRYQQRKRELLADKLLPADSESLPVASTWDVSVTHILDEEGMTATPERSISWNILQAICYLHSEDIPCALLERWLQEAGFAKDDVEVKQKLEAALTHLHDYSLIQRSSDRQTVSLHRLVQEVMRGRFGMALHKKSAEEKGETKSETSPSLPLLETKAVMPTKPEDKAKAAEAKEISEALSKNKEGRTQSKNSRLVEAESSLRESMSIFKRYDKSYAIDLGKCYLDLALVLAQQLKKEQAQECVEEAHKLLVAQYGAVHPLVARCEHVRHYIKSPLATGRRELMRWPSADIPASSSLVFIGREKYLAQLAKSVDLTEAYKKAPRTVLVGLEGMGKTALARQYWHSADYAYDLRVWFQADDAATLLREYQNFAKELGLFPREAKGEPSESEVIYAVKSYLESYPDWLVVYDNAGPYQALKLFLPNQGGHVVITTCRREWQEVAQMLEVEIMEEKESIAYLTQAMGITEKEDHEALAKLTKLAGCLPFLLRRICEYLKTNKIKPSQCLSEEVFRDLVKQAGICWDPYINIIKQEEKVEGCDSIFSHILKALAEKSEGDGFEMNVSRQRLEDWIIEEKLSNDIEQAKKYLDRSIGQLKKYSLIKTRSDLNIISIYGIFKENILKKFSTIASSIPVSPVEEKSADLKIQARPMLLFIQTLIDSVLIEYDHKTQVLLDEARQRVLFPHMQALEKHFRTDFQSQECSSARFGLLLSYIGNVLQYQIGEALSSKSYYKRALDIYEINYGSEHAMVAMALNNLANACLELGDSKHHKMLLERALTIQKACYGADHWQVAMTLNNLGTGYGALGDDITKKELLECALKIDENYYGPDHWQLSALLNNLANAYGGLGKNKIKKMLLERALKIAENHYGLDHWQVSIVLGDLANAYGVLGDARTKKKLLERALKIKESQYGLHHWQVADTLINLSAAHADLGFPLIQKMLLERALKIQSDFYGSDCWQISLTLNNLATAYGVLGNPLKQKELLERALKIQEPYYGPNHKEVARTLSNLAIAYGVLLNHPRKKELLERALKIQETHYGVDHQEIAATLNNLGIVYRDIDNFKEAKTFLERALKIKERSYGFNHWQVANTLLNLASVLAPSPDEPKERMIEALQLTERAYHIFSASYSDPMHHSICEAKSFLDQLLSVLPQQKPISRVSSPVILDLLTKHEEFTAQLFFEEQRITFNDLKVHRLLAERYKQQKNLKGVICHTEMVLSLIQAKEHSVIHLAALYHNLGCYYHYYACEQEMINDDTVKQKAIEKARHYFEASIKLKPQIGIYAEYANFLLQQQHNSEAILQLETGLQLVSKEKEQLNYAVIERYSLDTNLQQEVDFFQYIAIDAAIFTHYLLVLAYIKQADHSSAKTTLRKFQKLADQANSALVFSLLGCAWQIYGDYTLATACYEGALKIKPDYVLVKQRIDSCNKLLASASPAETASTMSLVAETKIEKKASTHSTFFAAGDGKASIPDGKRIDAESSEKPKFSDNHNLLSGATPVVSSIEEIYQESEEEQLKRAIQMSMGQ